MSKQTKKLTLSAMFLSIGLVLPLFTAQIKEIGDTLLPMHLPVMLCGLVCGAPFGALVGFIMPFMRSLIFAMPPIYPNAVWMACEMAVYGFMIGFVYSKLKNKNLLSIYISLVAAQISGRIVWGIVKALLLGAAGKNFTFALFLTGGFVDAVPGILLQLVLVPLIMTIINKATKKDINGRDCIKK